MASIGTGSYLDGNDIELYYWDNKKRFNVKCYEWETIPVENEKISNLVQKRAIVYVSLETLEDFILLRNAFNCDIISFNRNGEEYLEIYDDYIE